MKKLIEYGDYSCAEWNGIINLEDPLFKAWFKAVKPYLIGYEFWIYGGVIESWLTFDIDATIIGPNNPQHINWMLSNIARVSFEYGIFPDIKYSIDNKIFKWSQWVATRESVTCKYAYYRPSMIVNGKLIKWGTLEDGLYVASRKWPMNKSIYMDHNFKDPIQIA